jgi:hypothetical protein
MTFFLWPRRAAVFSRDWFRSTGLGYWVGGLWACYRYDRHAWVPYFTGKHERGFACQFCQRTAVAVEKAQLDQAGIESEAKTSCP